MKENINNKNANEFTNKQKSTHSFTEYKYTNYPSQKKIYLNKFKTHATCNFNVRQDRRPIWTDTKKLLRPGRSIGSLDGCESRQPMCIPNEVIL